MLNILSSGDDTETKSLKHILVTAVKKIVKSVIWMKLFNDDKFLPHVRNFRYENLFNGNLKIILQEKSTYTLHYL